MKHQYCSLTRQLGRRTIQLQEGLAIRRVLFAQRGPGAGQRESIAQLLRTLVEEAHPLNDAAADLVDGR